MNSSNQVTAFNFNTSTIRVVTLEGNPWFVAKDVCGSLGLADFKGGIGHHLTALEPDEVTPSFKVGVKLGGRGEAHVRLISESGLYKLIMRSDKKQAKVFQDWVTKEVLPSIRKTGSYSIHKEPQQLPLLDKPKGAPVGDRLEAIGVLLKDTVDALLGIISSQSSRLDKAEAELASMREQVRTHAALPQVIPAEEEYPDEQYITSAYFLNCDLMHPRPRYDLIVALGGAATMLCRNSNIPRKPSPGSRAWTYPRHILRSAAQQLGIF